MAITNSSLNLKIGNPADAWFKEAVIYQVHVRAFFDSDADGQGDFRGLTEKLDYIQDFGATCVLLLPFYESPLRDDGYDIADFLCVHPDCGTMADFDAFLGEAHSRGLRVINQLVLNHTSDQHAWFQAACQSETSEYRDFYVWSDTDERFRGASVILPEEQSNWTWEPRAGQYYWHRFFKHEPDLNYDNPTVRQAMIDVVQFWLNKGVDGVQCVAAPYLFERDGSDCTNLPETHHFFKTLRSMVDERYEDRVLFMGESQAPDALRQYFGTGDEFHVLLHSPLTTRMFVALRNEQREPIFDILDQTLDIPKACQWGISLRNHGQGSVLGEEGGNLGTSPADGFMRLDLPMRRRLAPLVEDGRRQMELLYSLQMSLPGTPIMYYGDEIGMGDNVHLKDPRGLRTPMQWNGDRNGGFSFADAERLYCPPVSGPTYGFQAVNVEAQLGVQTSLLVWLKRLIAIRKQFKALSLGQIRLLRPENPRVLAYVRDYLDERLLMVCNLSRFVQAVELDLSDYQHLIPVEPFGHYACPAIGTSPYFFTLGPHGFFWFVLTPPP